MITRLIKLIDEINVLSHSPEQVSNYLHIEFSQRCTIVSNSGRATCERASSSSRSQLLENGAHPQQPLQSLIDFLLTSKCARPPRDNAVVRQVLQSETQQVLDLSWSDFPNDRSDQISIVIPCSHPDLVSNIASKASSIETINYSKVSI